jgi:hypothetical protein
MLAFNSTFYFGAYFTEQYFTGFYTYCLLIFTIHTVNIMSQHHEQQQERSWLKNLMINLFKATTSNISPRGVITVVKGNHKKINQDTSTSILSVIMVSVK